MAETLEVSFTDEVLDPRRTTRSDRDQSRDRVDSVIAGDLLLVDTSAYGGPGVVWCRFRTSSPGSASVYPFKVEIPGRGVGQYRADEILAWVRPLGLHALMLELEQMTVLS